MQPIIKSLDERMINVRQKFGDSISVNAIGTIVDDVMHSVKGDLVLAELHFQDELRELISFIEKTKAEISHIKPKHLSETRLPDASNHLDEVVEATAVAAETIMDAAEEVSAIAEDLEGDVKERLEAASMKIFEASSFQDITGQRVTKVVETLKYLEIKLGELAKSIDDADHDEDAHLSDDERHHKDLLAGPQLTDTANDQDAIDALFDDFD
jgi:chemotaxis protein CheZ